MHAAICKQITSVNHLARDEALTVRMLMLMRIERAILVLCAMLSFLKARKGVIVRTRSVAALKARYVSRKRTP
jgi:hypothetical protein